MTKLINKKVPRLMIGATGSGSGKTTVVCALLEALKNRGIHPNACKCGPDYIDPMFHSRVIGTPSVNLDLFLTGENALKYILIDAGRSSKFQGLINPDLEEREKDSSANEEEVTIIEGVMGLYDGMGFSSDDFSSNHIARITDTPTILVTSARGKSLSLIAELFGFLNYGDNRIKGLILNDCNPGSFSFYKEAIEEALPIKVYGYLPRIEGASLESRRMGLVPAAEVEDLKRRLEILGERAEETIDIDGLLELAGKASEVSCRDMKPASLTDKKVRIGVAYDKAFCFYYDPALRYLEDLGAELIPFSPVEDDDIPKGAMGLILGGGFPELAAKDLSSGDIMKSRIAGAVKAGMPVYAEGGGFAYLGRSLKTEEGKFDMAGVFPLNVEIGDKLINFGYKELIAERDSLICKKGESIKAHEFHYGKADMDGSIFTWTRRTRTGKAFMSEKNALAGYPHIHFLGNPITGENFVKACLAYGEGISCDE
jgi:cobyrinic acid a,c-diamide synthase